MKKKIIHLIAAARPNFMKVAPLYHALYRERWCDPVLIHTGQHYDPAMSASFIRELRLPNPRVHLGIGSGTHAEQTGGVMIAYEKVCIKNRPDYVIVVGDVNSTVACALTAKKLAIPVAHLEAGLRSRDMTMPEELNRIMTDAICDILWIPSADAGKNLMQEGIRKNRIVFVGNIMIDSYEMLKKTITSKHMIKNLGLRKGNFGLVTLHRPHNVDNRTSMCSIIAAFKKISRLMPIVFPVHPRTRSRLKSFNLWGVLNNLPNVYVLDPLGYISFMSLVQDARLLITDSGGIQEETTYLHIPCLTLRSTTERPVTVRLGTNKLVRIAALYDMVKRICDHTWPKGSRPHYWDGHTAERVVRSLKTFIKNKQ